MAWQQGWGFWGDVGWTKDLRSTPYGGTEYVFADSKAKREGGQIMPCSCSCTVFTVRYAACDDQ